MWIIKSEINNYTHPYCWLEKFCSDDTMGFECTDTQESWWEMLLLKALYAKNNQGIISRSWWLQNLGLKSSAALPAR